MGYKENEILLERIITFGENIIDLCNKLPKNLINNPLISQLIDSASSIGANYSEACGGESAKDFIHKIKIARKEAQETRFFLRLILKANPDYKTEIIFCGKEAMELVKIFSTIISRFRTHSKIS